MGIIILIPEEEVLNDQSQAEVLADFRQAWHEAMTGQTIPVTQLWEGLENDCDRLEEKRNSLYFASS
ncbi:hypothetical protein [Nostoc sp. CALU 1950]|uniref:hypothetical protein n=1 Tax=Nostoc sp. CALU 1950 TaxID=3104321 RepID=UPI003EBEC3B9